MHFLVSALGSAGDVLPFVTIAQALQARSHDVQVIAAAPFADRVEQAGIAFIALGTDDDYQRMVRDPDLWHPRRGARLMIDQLLRRLPEAIAVTEAAARPRTVLVGSSLSWGMRLVQEQRGLPGATVHLAPSLLRSALRPPVLPGGTDLSRLPPPVVRWLQWAGERFVLDRWIAPRLNRQRAGRGLPPVRDIWSRWMDSPDLVIGAWPA